MKKIKIAASGIFFTGIFPVYIFPEINLISAGKAPMGTFIAWFAVLLIPCSGVTFYQTTRTFPFNLKYGWNYSIYCSYSHNSVLFGVVTKILFTLDKGQTLKFRFKSISCIRAFNFD